MKEIKQDEKFIKRCIELSKESVAKGDAPFGSLITYNGKILAESINSASNRVSDHAEILVLDKAHKKLGTSDLSQCTLYTNCEPCPMCSFMIREYKIKKVVFALASPYMGGFSKWKILQDKELTTLLPFFGKVPEIIFMKKFENEAKRYYKNTPLWMFGSKIKKRKSKKQNTI